MKDKNYYIPKIEELHPGMDIELYYRKGTYDYSNTVSVEDGGDGLPLFIPDEKEKSWHKHTIPSSENDDIYWQYPLARFKEIIDEGIIRIKHLDENDFNKLNWERYSTSPKGILYRGYKNERLQSVRIIYIPHSKHVLVYAIDVPLHDQTVFAGTVQNISELKVIINQLKIKPV